jgi:transposase
MNITTIGLDLAKSTFHVVGLDAEGREQLRKCLSRSQVIKYFAQSPACLVGMEACGGSDYFARALGGLGHTVKLVPAQYVKAYLRGQKNDYNDARAIAEAVRSPQLRGVAVKTVEQQDVQSLIRLREGAVNSRTAVVNRLRGLLAEYGVVVRPGVNALRRALPMILEDVDNALSERFRRLLRLEQQHLDALEAHVRALTEELLVVSKQDARVRQLQSAPGYGPIVASVFVNAIGDGRQYSCGRDVSAALGIVPRQHSSGGKQVLLGISKRGDRYLRSLLIHGARAVVNAARKKDDPLSRWVNQVRATRGINKATVALANKLARIGWAIVRHGNPYQAALACAQG